MQQELEIEDLVIGTGKAAERGALITAHYVGWLEDGTDFNSSYKHIMSFQIFLSYKCVIYVLILVSPDIQSRCINRFFVSPH